MVAQAFVLADFSAWRQTFGRMHVVIVHFPIALMAIAGMYEMLRLARKKGKPSSFSIACIILGVISAAAASAMGWVHRDYSSFSGDSLITLQRHQWLGIITAIFGLVTLIPLLFYREKRLWPTRLFQYGAIICALLVGITGHLGGTLTHGSGYLTELIFAPSHGDDANGPAGAVPAALVKRDIKTIHFPANGQIDFIRDVQPLLADQCYQCHGPTKRSGALRLDNKESTFKGGNMGPTITLGKPADESVLIKRLMGVGIQKRMPLDAPPLADEHIHILKAWIEQGAKWPDSASNSGGVEAKHWSFVKPVRPELPAVQNIAWVRNPIDNFILARLEKEGLKPSPEADRATLIRRVSLDLIGLPPTPEEVDAFVADKSPDAYDRLVNRLLASPHYGERWGRHWLDVARYADTNGYEKDMGRSIWPYRDWVINAINRDMTFDQFVIQQMAGDMLPNATVDEKIATGFNRNTMQNEEGGIDVEEFRFKSLIDRVQTTSTAFLGLTMQCAQCHNHKYDPISQKDYYQFMAFINNADEPVLKIPDLDVSARRKMIQGTVDKMESDLADEFPTHDEKLTWEIVTADKLSAASGAVLTTLPDQSILASGPVAEKDVYNLQFNGDFKDVIAIRLEVLPDRSLPLQGPGRAESGNLVASELHVTRTPDGGAAEQVGFSGVTADFSQDGFDVAGLIDGDPDSGWGIATEDQRKMHVTRTAVIHLAKPLDAGKATLDVALDQNFPRHSIGRLRISVGRDILPPTTMPVERQRQEFLASKQSEWEKDAIAKSAHWTVLDPEKFTRNYDATITKLPDHSLLYTGDSFYRDEYKIECETELKNVTAVRLEVLPHPDLPHGGPGRSKTGGFDLTEFNVDAVLGDGSKPAVPLTVYEASADSGEKTIARAIDGKRDTHWEVPSGESTARTAVFRIKDCPDLSGKTKLTFHLIQNLYESQNLGRVRISVTSDINAVAAVGVPPEVESILLTPAGQRTPEQSAAVRRQFLLNTPLLAREHEKIHATRNSMPEYATTLVMKERDRPRVTNIHHRGEFLQLDDVVQPGTPAILHPMPKDVKPDRMALALWLVDPENPLIARVTVNRMWERYFGHGIVASVDNFGLMGDAPSHPELLDWLATEFVRQNWSMKAMHRLIVTSATYRQSSATSPELLERDPVNVLYARAPRMRVEAEIVRDIALTASGLLNPEIGGPSVFPPQAPGISEACYVPFHWPTSQGPERYRRGLYTYLKRSTPYPMTITFDGPNAETTCTRRNRSDTPLQALATLNDVVYMEAAQHMAQRVMGETTDDPDTLARARYAMRLCVGRQPQENELKRIVQFHDTELTHFRDKRSDAAAVAGAKTALPPKNLDMPDLAAWTLVCRAVLNLDETLTKN